MWIEVLRPFRGHVPGQRFDWPDGMANELIRRGMVKPVEEAEEKAVDAPLANKMIAKPARKKAVPVGE